VVIGGVNAACELVLPPRRLDWAELEVWFRAHLLPTDKVVIEATTNTWTLYDQAARYAGAVMAHPPHIKLIGAALVKTDKRDVQVLAKLLALNLIPEVWVPPQPMRELRELVAHRERLTRARTQTTNRLHSMLQRHNLAAPQGDPFAAQHRAWWASLDLSATEKLHVRQDLDTRDHLTTQIAEVEQELARLSTVSPWAPHVPLLIQLPGIGLLTALVILAAVGDITRFAHAKNLVGYAGLGTYVHDSGKTHRHGGITKHGRADLRHAMVEAAWVAARTRPHWQAETCPERSRRVRAAVQAHARQPGQRRHRPQAAGRRLARLARPRGRLQCPSGQGRRQVLRLVWPPRPHRSRAVHPTPVRALAVDAPRPRRRLDPCALRR